MVINIIVLFSAAVSQEGDLAEEWIQRTRSLLSLSLVSRSFCAEAIPFLYRDIRINSIPESRVSRLMTTLNHGITNPRTSDDSPSGYGPYTKTLLLCVKNGSDTLPADTQGLLGKMTKLHTLLIRTADFFWKAIPLHSLRSVEFLGVDLLLISDQRTLRMLVPFQRLYAGHVCGLNRGLSEVRNVPLLPNLQDINIWHVFPRGIIGRKTAITTGLLGIPL